MRHVLLVCCITVCSFLLGCGEEGLDGVIPVSGTVKYKGQPVEGATIVFNPKESKSRAASAITDAEGKFILTTLRENDGAMPGRYNVFVSKTDVQGKTGLTPEEARDSLKKAKAIAPPRKELVPKRYQTESGGLFAEVKKGETNEFTFDLTD